MLTSLVLFILISSIQSLYNPGGHVELLKGSDFKAVMSSDDVWMVEFFAPWCGHCKSLAPEWEKAAKALKGVAHIAAVDATVDQDLASKYSVKGFPTIFIFSSDKSKPEQYQGPRTASAIVDDALKHVRDVVKMRLSGKKSHKKEETESSDVLHLTTSNFEKEVLDSKDAILVEFFAPWCGHCKRLAPEWEKAATELKGSMKLAAVDATAEGELAGRYEVKGYPTIKFFPPGDKSAPIDYDGGRTANAIVEWALAKLDELGAGNEVEEITSEQQLRDKCLSKKICILGFLPLLIDSGAAGRRDYISLLQSSARKLRGKLLAVAWMEGGTQAELENAFHLSFGYPAVVAVSESKQRYAVLKRSFSLESVTGFLRDAVAGRVATTPFKLPTIVTTEPWNGEDYVPPPEDE